MNKSERLKYIVILLIILTLTSYFMAKSMTSYSSGDVAIIKIKGVLLTDKAKIFGQDVTSSSSIVDFIEQADQTPGIKAILFEINSPGGSPVASKEIADAIKRTDKLTIALIREVGASGAYWVASATDTIIANELSMTGSIGVIGSYLEFSGLLDKYNVTYQRLVAGKYKDLGSPFRELNDDEKEILQKVMDKIHQKFIDEVVSNRDLDEDKLDEITTGMWFLGDDAKELGLVDILGDKNTAVEYLKKELNQSDVSFIEYEESTSLIEALQGVNFRSIQPGILT